MRNVSLSSMVMTDQMLTFHRYIIYIYICQCKIHVIALEIHRNTYNIQTKSATMVARRCNRPELVGVPNFTASLSDHSDLERFLGTQLAQLDCYREHIFLDITPL